jgi:hypothetical protein
VGVLRASRQRRGDVAAGADVIETGCTCTILHTCRVQMIKRIAKPRRAPRCSRYAITRIESKPHRTFAWIVSVQRRKQIWRRTFSDRSYGGKIKALTAAKTFRDQILSQHPPMSRAEYCRIKRRNNKSGLAGVCRYIYPGGHDRPANQLGYWLAFWTLAPGKGKRIKFSIDRFGERGALKRAMRARKEALAALDGQWVNSEGLRHWLRSRREPSRTSTSADMSRQSP